MGIMAMLRMANMHRLFTNNNSNVMIIKNNCYSYLCTSKSTVSEAVCCKRCDVFLCKLLNYDVHNSYIREIGKDSTCVIVKINKFVPKSIHPYFLHKKLSKMFINVKICM